LGLAGLASLCFVYNMGIIFNVFFFHFRKFCTLAYYSDAKLANDRFVISWMEIWLHVYGFVESNV